MTNPVIDAMNFTELAELQKRIAARIAQMREQGAPQLLEKFEREAAALGLSVDEVCGNGKRRKRRHSRRAFSFFRKAPREKTPVSPPLVPAELKP